MSPEIRSNLLRNIWLQLPFLLWLVALWMLLWAQFTLLSFVTGVIVAIVVTRIFRLPTVSLGGRLNVWYSFLFIVQFLWAVVRGAVGVTLQVWNLKRQPGAAIVAIPLRYADDLVMTHVSITASLIPGSLVVEADRFRRILYLHIIGADTMQDVEAMRRDVLNWERRIVRAVGSPAQYRALKADERAGRVTEREGER